MVTLLPLASAEEISAGLAESSLATSSPPQAAPLSCPEHQLAEFLANYEVLRNGRLMGWSEVRLRKSGNDWSYQVTTEADRGLAGLLGGKVTETSHFRITEAGELQSMAYEYQQGIRFSRREGKARFDWDRLQVEGVYKKDSFQLPLVKGQTDRMLLNLKLMRLLSQGAQRFEFETVERGTVKQMAFHRSEQQALIDTPEGRLATIMVSREHRNTKRHTRSWHAPELGYLPVRMQQVEDDDDETIEMRLTGWQREPCAA